LYQLKLINSGATGSVEFSPNVGPSGVWSVPAGGSALLPPMTLGDCQAIVASTFGAPWWSNSTLSYEIVAT